MASGNPAELKKEGEDLKALFAKVKKKQHNCAILMAKEGIVIETHIKKSPEVLLKAAKKAGGMPKGVWGTMTMEGQIIIVDPVNDKIPGNLAKIAKKHFSERGIKFRLEIKEPDEEAKASSDSEEEEEELQMSSRSDEEEEEIQMSSESEEEEELQLAEGASREEDQQTKSSPTEDPKKALEDKLAGMQKQIDELQADTENVMHSELVDALRGHERVMGEGNFEGAVDTLRRIEVALEDYAAIQAKKMPLQKRFDDMVSDMDRVESGDDATAKEQIATAKRGFEYALPKRDWDEAKRFLDNIEQAIKDSGDENSEQETEEMAAPEANVEREETTTSPEESNEAVEPESSDEDEEDPVVAELRGRYEQSSSDIDALMADKENVMHDQLVEALRSYESQMQEGRHDRAFDSIARIESILSDYNGLLAKSKPLQDRQDKMQPDIARIKSGDDDEAIRAIDEAERGFARAIRLREWDDANLHLEKMERHIEAFKEKQTEESSDEREDAMSADQSNEREETTASEAPSADEEPTNENSVEKDPKAEKAALVKRFAKSKDGLGKILKAGNTMSGVDPRVLAQDFGKYMKSEEFTSADQSLSQIEELIKEAGNTPEKKGRMARIAEMKKGLGSLLKELN